MPVNGAIGGSGFEALTHSPERRALFDLRRRTTVLERTGSNIVAVPYDQWPPTDPQPDTLYLRLAP